MVENDVIDFYLDSSPAFCSKEIVVELVGVCREHDFAFDLAKELKELEMLFFSHLERIEFFLAISAICRVRRVAVE